MNCQQEKVISKIRKMLALTKGNYQGEAETAMLKAQELLVEYNLTMRDIEDKEDLFGITEEVIEHKSPPWWFFKLAGIVADNFRCDVIRHNYSNQRRKGFRFIGRETDVGIAVEVLNFAAIVIRHNVKPYQARSTRYGNTYIAGFLAGLSDKFAEQVERNEWGLVLVKGPEVSEATEKYKPKERKNIHVPSFTKSALIFEQGYDDGLTFEYRQKRLNA